MKVRIVLLLALAAGLLTAQGCAFVIRTPRAQGSSNPRKTDRPIAEYQQTVIKKYDAEDFPWLASEASRIRSGKERLPGGYWKLRAFYDAVAQPQGADQSDSAWQNIFGRLGRWRKAQPQEVTPLIATAATWFNYAWEARGGGRASTVSPSAWGAFRERLELAKRFLDDAQALNQKCPEFYHQALLIGIGLHWSPNEFDKYFAEGTALEPTYYYLYQQKAVYLLPRWYGSEGEWERFADEASNKVGGEQGDVVFFAIYSLMKEMHNINFMVFHRQAAPRIVAGFRAIERLYGASPRRVNEACMASLLIDDPKTTAELLARADKELDEEIWESRETFETLRFGFWQEQKAKTQTQKSQSLNAKR